MPPRKQPKSLEWISRDRIFKIISDVVDHTVNRSRTTVQTSDDWDSLMNEFTNMAQQTSDYISRLPITLLENLSLQSITLVSKMIDEKRSYLPGSLWQYRYNDIIRLLIKLVLYPSIKHLDITDLRSRTGVAVFIENLQFLSDIRELRLPGEQIPSGIIGDLKNNIHHITNLTRFELRDECNDGIIEEISRHCPNITEINVCCSPEVTDRSVTFLLNLPNLEDVDVCSTSVTSSGYRAILSGLPLLHIHWNSEDISSIFIGIDSEKLKKIISFHGTVDSIQILVNKCPNLKKLTVGIEDIIDLTPISTLNLLNYFQILEEFFSSSGMKAIFPKIGQNLETLIMISVYQLDFSVIIEYCICLKRLSIKQSTFANPDRVTSIEPTLPHFHSLLYLILDGNGGDEWYINNVKYYTCLEILRAHMVKEFNDQYFAGAIAYGGFRHLQKMVLKNCGALSMRTVELVWLSCPKLSVLGLLLYWSEITERDIQNIENRIRQNNYDLDIL